MEGLPLTPETKHSTPQDELAFLRERLKKLESQVESGEREPAGEEPAETLVKTYAQKKPEEVLAPEAVMHEQERRGITLDLPPERHDERMAEFLGVLQEKGVRNALSVVEDTGNKHLIDDFHRFVAQYIKEGYTVSGVKEREPLYKALHMTLYEVSLPENTDKESGLKELISAMEQFYAGMRAVSGSAKERNHFTIEIAQASEGEEVAFYVSVPTERKDLFEKQLLGAFPDARVVPHNADYNIWGDEGVTEASVAELEGPKALPIRQYDEFDTDPLNVLLNAFSKLASSGEGAAVQFVVQPSPDYTEKNIRAVRDKVQKGTSLKEAAGGKSLGKELAGAAFELLGPTKKKNDDKEKQVDTVSLELINKKLEDTLFDVNIRIVTSAPDEIRAKASRRELESAFNQFEEGHGNRFDFTRVSGRKCDKLIKQFTFRLFDQKTSVVLNTAELTTVAHFPATQLKSATQLKRSKAGTAPAPLNLPKEGVLLGINRHREQEREVRFAEDDRLRHFYVIGQTGTGKTTLLKNMIVQDIQAGRGVCMIDPHGTDITDILANVPPERYDDVIYFDPAYTPRPMGLNMLEYDERYPEQKTFAVNELLSIFNKLFDMKVAGGPMFEQYFRNAALLVMDDPSSGNTLIDLSRVLAEKSYRQLKLERSKNPIVNQFWREIAEKAGGEGSLQNVIPYITSKFDVFLSNDIMRPVIAQEHSSFNFRRVMDEQKILLVNLSKGRLGDINANLIGLILVGKILMAALSRVDSDPKSLPPFYLYIDEFQNITTDSISSILSEARKYGLSLNIAHQFIKQLDESIKDSVFGNVGSLCAFRTSSDDAEFLEKQFEPTFTAADIMNLDNRKAYLKLLINGAPEKPFNIATIKPEEGDPARIELLKEMSYQKFGRDRTEVEQEIMGRYKATESSKS